MIAASSNTIIMDNVSDIANGIFAGFSILTDTYNKRKNFVNIAVHLLMVNLDSAPNVERVLMENRM